MECTLLVSLSDWVGELGCLITLRISARGGAERQRLETRSGGLRQEIAEVVCTDVAASG